MKSTVHSVLVIGEKPEEMMFEFSLEKKVAPYVKYKRSDAKKMKQAVVTLYKKVLESNVPGFSKDLLKQKYLEYKDMSDFDYYLQITEGCTFNEDSLDAYSTDNPDAKFMSYNKDFTTNHFSLPFTLLDGTEVFQARKEEIDWPMIHMYNNRPYERAWEMVMEGDEPMNDEEKQIYEAMKNRTAYFQSFGNKENYVISSCAFCEFACLNKDGWHELDNLTSDFEWRRNFYEKFVAPADGKDLFTIYEYREIV